MCKQVLVFRVPFTNITFCFPLKEESRLLMFIRIFTIKEK